MLRTHVHSVRFSTFHRESMGVAALLRVLAVLNEANALSKRSQFTWRIGADTLTDGWRERGGQSRARGNLLERSLFGVRISNIVCMEEDLLRHNHFYFFVIFQICKCLYRNSTHTTEVNVLPCVTCMPCRAYTSATFLSSIYVYTISSR